MKLLKISVSLLIVVAFLWGCISPELRSARIAMNEQDWQRALTNLEQELTINPTSAEALWRMGVCYEKLSDWARMSEYYDRSLAQAPQFKDAIERSRSRLVGQYMRRVFQQDSLGHRDSALVHLDVTLVINPHDILLYQTGAIIAYNGGIYDRATEYAHRALKMEGEDERDIATRQVLLEIASSLGNEQEATKWALELMGMIDPNEEQATYLRSLDAVVTAYEKIQAYDQAVPFVQKAIDLFPDIIALRKNLAVLYDQAGQTDKAMGVYIEILEFTPDDFGVNNYLAYMYLKQERYQEAIPYLEKAYSLKADERGVINNLMKAYFETGQDEKGQEMVKKLKELPEEPEP